MQTMRDPSKHRSVLNLIPFTGPQSTESGAVLVWAQGGFQSRMEHFTDHDFTGRPCRLLVSFTHPNRFVQQFFRGLGLSWASLMFEAPSVEALQEIIDRWEFTEDSPRLDQLELTGPNVEEVEYIPPRCKHGVRRQPSLD